MGKHQNPLDNFKLHYEHLPVDKKRKISVPKPTRLERVKTWLKELKENLEDRNLI